MITQDKIKTVLTTFFVLMATLGLTVATADAELINEADAT